MPTPSFRDLRADRLADEVGTIHKHGGLRFALCYPSPYTVGMSSLGFQTVYRMLNGIPDVSAERAFLPDDVPAARGTADPLRTYESGRPVGDFPVVAFSLAYELELAGLVDCLDLAGIPIFADERAAHAQPWPLIVIGGPLTFSNPVPGRPLRRRDRDGRGRGDAPRAGRRDSPGARPRGACSPAWRRAPGSTCRRSTERRCRRSSPAPTKICPPTRRS